MEKLYKVQNLQENPNDIAFEITLADKNHEVFKAHFPDYPLLPAFMQIDIVGEVLNLNITQIIRSKFITPFLPNDKITYNIKKTDNSYKCITTKENKKASEFSLVC